ncbi:glycosyltransferase [Mycobacterium sp. BMJ-28]
MRVLLLTPFSPLVAHDHAGNDLALPLVTSLAPFMDLHVYAPGQQLGHARSWQVDGVTYHQGATIQRSRLERLRTYPYAARASWSRKSTEEAAALIRALRPDIAHGEYWQCAEPLLQSGARTRTSITLHDVPGEVDLSVLPDSSRLARYLHRYENWKTIRVRRRILSELDAVFTLSELDGAKVAEARGVVTVASVGVEVSGDPWRGDRQHVVAFGGAMWRLENQAAAEYLARRVLPLVRCTVADAELRIFGARPNADVRALSSEPGVTVVGEVEDYDDEFRRAGVTVAPAMVNAGVLMKAIRPMAMGCPVVLNGASARQIAGLVPGQHALVGGGPEELAAHISTLMQDRSRAHSLGQSASALVLDAYSWSRTAAVYKGVFEKLAVG